MRYPDALGRASPSETVIPFAPAGKQTGSGTNDSLDSAGQSILRLLHQAAGAAEENSRHALDVARKLSLQLQSAEDRVKDLEADVRYFHGRAERAEQWLSQISSEIEQRFFRVADGLGPQDRPQQQKDR
jgi:hypothetical protein